MAGLGSLDRAKGGGYRVPPLPRLHSSNMRGPTPWSNWVIPGQVIAGGYPCSLDDKESDRILTLLLKLGMGTFVCLQAEVDLDAPEAAWRAGQAPRPYIHDARRLLEAARKTSDPVLPQEKLDYLQCSIIDGSVTTDNVMRLLAEDCVRRVRRGEKMYIHCWGGHGRTGTLVAIMLGVLYGLSVPASIHRCQVYHDSRFNPQQMRSPSSPAQRAQVRRILLAIHAEQQGRAVGVHKSVTSTSGTMGGKGGGKMGHEHDAQYHSEYRNPHRVQTMPQINGMRAGGRQAEGRTVTGRHPVHGNRRKGIGGGGSLPSIGGVGVRNGGIWPSLVK